MVFGEPKKLRRALVRDEGSCYNEDEFETEFNMTENRGDEA